MAKYEDAEDRKDHGADESKENDAPKHSAKRAEASRKAALHRLGRKKPSGMFNKIEDKAAKEYGSKDAGRRVAAAVYWKKVRARQHGAA